MFLLDIQSINLKTNYILQPPRIQFVIFFLLLSLFIPETV